jgi:hypothetical protein
MQLDLSKLQAVVVALQAGLAKLETDVPAAIAAAAAGVDETANQAAVDSITATLTTMSDAVGTLDTSVAPKAPVA